MKWYNHKYVIELLMNPQAFGGPMAFYAQSITRKGKTRTIFSGYTKMLPSQ